MPPSRSAGVLLYRGSGASLEVLLVHPGGPLWARRDAGAWSIPKGEYGADEMCHLRALFASGEQQWDAYWHPSRN